MTTTEIIIAVITIILSISACLISWINYMTNCKQIDYLLQENFEKTTKIHDLETKLGGLEGWNKKN